MLVVTGTLESALTSLWLSAKAVMRLGVGCLKCFDPMPSPPCYCADRMRSLNIWGHLFLVLYTWMTKIFKLWLIQGTRYHLNCGTRRHMLNWRPVMVFEFTLPTTKWKMHEVFITSAFLRSCAFDFPRSRLAVTMVLKSLTKNTDGRFLSRVLQFASRHWGQKWES